MLIKSLGEYDWQRPQTRVGADDPKGQSRLLGIVSAPQLTPLAQSLFENLEGEGEGPAFPRTPGTRDDHRR